MGRFERMRALEVSGAGERLYGWALSPGLSGGPEALKTRRGGSGGWREHFSPDETEFAAGLLAERTYFTRMTAAEEGAVGTYPS